MLTSAKLKGHRAAVLCLDISSPSLQSSATIQSDVSSTSSLLLSGSEDGTARLWDLREHKRRACLCIQTPGGGDVLSAVFAPLLGVTEKKAVQPTTVTIIPGKDNTPSCRTPAFARDFTVYLGVENMVLEYDLRNATSAILSEPSNNWGEVLQNQDEVNQISLAYYRKDNIRKNNNANKKKKKMNQKDKRGGGRGNNKKQQHQKFMADDSNKIINDSCEGEGSCSSSCSEGSLYLAACDDAGKVRWTEALSNHSNGNGEGDGSRSRNYSDRSNNSKILHHDEHGVAVVTASAFRPNNGNHNGNKYKQHLELVSGGTDCKIKLWDVHRPKEPISTFTINNNNIAQEDEKKKPQVCNPPFIYSLVWSKNGKKLASGLGDGTIGIFEINNRTLIQNQLLIGRGSSNSDVSCDEMHFAHNSSVVSVVFPSFSSSTDDRIFCSAGTDGQIVFWDLGDEQWSNEEENLNYETNNTYIDVVAQLFHANLLQGLNNHNNETAGTIHTNTMITKHKNYQPTILFEIPHKKKINWVTKATATDQMRNNDTIFVADTSPDITSYTIPF